MIRIFLDFIINLKGSHWILFVVMRSLSKEKTSLKENLIYFEDNQGLGVWKTYTEKKNVPPPSRKNS